MELSSSNEPKTDTPRSVGRINWVHGREEQVHRYPVFSCRDILQIFCTHLVRNTFRTDQYEYDYISLLIRYAISLYALSPPPLPDPHELGPLVVLPVGLLHLGEDGIVFSYRKMLIFHVTYHQRSLNFEKIAHANLSFSRVNLANKQKMS